MMRYKKDKNINKNQKNGQQKKKRKKRNFKRRLKLQKMMKKRKKKNRLNLIIFLNNIQKRPKNKDFYLKQKNMFYVQILWVKTEKYLKKILNTQNLMYNYLLIVGNKQKKD